MLRVPVSFSSIPRVHKVLKGEIVQLSFTTEQPDNVPVESVHVDPATGDPVFARLREEVA